MAADVQQKTVWLLSPQSAGVFTCTYTYGRFQSAAVWMHVWLKMYWCLDLIPCFWRGRDVLRAVPDERRPVGPLYRFTARRLRVLQTEVERQISVWGKSWNEVKKSVEWEEGRKGRRIRCSRKEGKKKKREKRKRVSHLQTIKKVETAQEGKGVYPTGSLSLIVNFPGYHKEAITTESRQTWPDKSQM